MKQGKGYALRTKRFVAESCLFHGAAATKSGAARAMIEAAKRIVFTTVNEHEKSGFKRRGCVAGNFAWNERKACRIRECWEGGPGALPGNPEKKENWRVGVSVSLAKHRKAGLDSQG